MFPFNPSNKIATALTHAGRSFLAAALALALVATCSGAPCAFAEASLEAGQIVSGAVATKATMAKKSKKVAIKKAKAAKVKTYTYTGKAIKPKVKLKYKGKKLKVGRDYKLSYRSSVNAGTAKIVVKGKGRFKGTKTVKFKIAKADIAKAIDEGELGSASFERTGKAIKPEVNLMYTDAYKKRYWLKAGRDYTVSYKDNVEPGTASAVVKGKGNFKGSKTIKFKIVGFKVEEKELWMFSNWGGCVYADDPTAIYPCNANATSAAKIPFKEVSLGDGVEKVDEFGQTYYVMKALDFNQPTTELVRMPDGLADAVWKLDERHTGNPDYVTVWGYLLMDAYEGKDSCQKALAANGIDIPLWFSEALYDIDHLYNSAGNNQTIRKWFLV